MTKCRKQKQLMFSFDIPFSSTTNAFGFEYAWFWLNARFLQICILCIFFVFWMDIKTFLSLKTFLWLCARLNCIDKYLFSVSISLLDLIFATRITGPNGDGFETQFCIGTLGAGGAQCATPWTWGIWRKWGWRWAKSSIGIHSIYPVVLVKCKISVQPRVQNQQGQDPKIPLCSVFVKHNYLKSNLWVQHHFPHFLL